MRIIVIESNAYKVTEKQFKTLWRIHDKFYGKGYHPSQDVEMSDFLEDFKKEIKDLGPIEYDFRL